MLQPDERMLTWVESHVGPCRVVRHVANQHAYSHLWRLEISSGHVWLKQHSTYRKWAGELHAMTTWSPSLGRTPSVIASRQEPLAVLLTEAEGANAEEVNLDGASEENLWTQAGAWLKEMHRRENDWLGDLNPDGTPQSEPDRDAQAFVWHQFDRRFIEGRQHGTLNAQELDFAQAKALEGLPSLAGEGAFSIHRDFTPRNWLANTDGDLTAVIDFEHARWDLKAADLNRPWDYEFYRNPRLIDAFYEGYGRADDRFMAQIQTLRLCHLVSATVWGLLVGETEFSDRNRAALHRMMDAHR